MKQLLLLLSLSLVASIGIAQESQNETTEVELQVKLLPYSNPLTDVSEEPEVGIENRVQTELDVELLRRISNVYKRHVLAIDAQVQGDLVQAENYINESFAAIQSLLDDYPEIQNNRRFTEL